MEHLVPVALFLSLAYSIVGVTRIISDARTRRRLLELGTTAEVARAASAITSPDPGLHSTLRAALVIGAVGLALVLVPFLPYRAGGPITIGLVLRFGAGGLLAYYATARRSVRQ